jgi:hypothetical protein
MKKLIKTAVGNMVGIGLIGATAGMVNQMPAGTAKDISGIVPGLQSVALVSHNAKLINPRKQKGSYKHKHSKTKLKW